MFINKILENWCTWFLTLKHLFLSFAGTSQFGFWDHVWDRGGWDVVGWYGKLGLFLQAINSNCIKTFGFEDMCNFHFLSRVPIFLGELPNGRQLQVALCEFSGRVQEECQEPGSEGHPRHTPPAARHHGIAMGRALVTL